MLRYKKYRENRENSRYNRQWYGRAIHELVEFDEFVKHMANHHCVFSEATIKGVLIEMETCLRELLLNGKAVRIDDLSIFRIGMKTLPDKTLADFTAANIEGVRLNLYLGKRFRAADLYKEAKFAEVGKYAVGVELDGEDATDGV